MKTIFGVLWDKHGICATRSVDADGQLRMRAWGTPTEGVRRTQPEFIGIDCDHGAQRGEGWLGEIVHLEVDKIGRLWAVGHANINPPEWLLPLYWSAHSNANQDGSDAIIDAISLTPATKRLTAQPVVILDGQLPGSAQNTPLNRFERDLLTRASGTAVRRRSRSRVPHTIYHPPVDLSGYDHPALRAAAFEEQWAGGEQPEPGRPPGRLHRWPSRKGSVIAVR